MLTLRLESTSLRTMAAKPASLQSAAAGNLHYIRATMAASGAFTSVSGAGMTLAGTVACVAAAVVLLTPAGDGWPLVWLIAAALAAPTASLLMARKAARSGVSMTRGIGRRFLFALLPGFAAVAILSCAMLISAQWTLVPATWLLGYGASVCAAGALSVGAVRLLGLFCMTCGTACTLVGPAQQQWLLLAGFGGAHLAVGAYIWRRHGG
jgi:hypothetical protein